MGTLQSRHILYLCLFFAGAANAPLIYRMVASSPVPDAPIAAEPAAEVVAMAEDDAAPPAASLFSPQLSLNDQAPQLYSSSVDEEPSAPNPPAMAGALPLTVGLVGGGGSSAASGGYGGGGSAMGSGGRGFAGGGGGMPAGGRPGSSAQPASAGPGAPAAAPSGGGGNTVAKPKPRLFLASEGSPQTAQGGPSTHGGGRPAGIPSTAGNPGGNPGTDRSSSPASTAPPTQIALAPTGAPLDSFVPHRPADEQQALPQVTLPSGSALQPLDPRNGPDSGRPQLLEVVDSHIASGLSPAIAPLRPGSEELGPAIADIEDRVADGSENVVVARYEPQPSTSGPDGGAPAAIALGGVETLTSSTGPSQVPEPMTLALVGLGLGLAGTSMRRRRISRS